MHENFKSGWRYSTESCAAWDYMRSLNVSSNEWFSLTSFSTLVDTQQDIINFTLSDSTAFIWDPLRTAIIDP